MASPGSENQVITNNPGVSIFDRKSFPVMVGVMALIIIVLVIYFFNFFPDYSHLKIKILSGSESGNYYSLIEGAKKTAAVKHGVIDNIPTNGSIDNISILEKSRETGVFALSQDGMPWGKDLEFIASMTSPETVFFIGPDADRIKGIPGMANRRIGIGPKGSGTAHTAEKFFSMERMKSLNVRLSYHTSDEQLQLLRDRKLDLGVFIISEKSAFIEKAVCEYKMQIMNIAQAENISRKMPFLKTGYIPAGYYDPVNNLPASRKKILRVYTLLLSNGQAKRSQVIGLLSILNSLHPNLVKINRDAVNYTGLPESPPARDFFNNSGPEILDRYAPRLMDIMPLSNLVQIIMVISVLFNVMGIANRFRLWRIDVNRVNIENKMRNFLGWVMLPDEVEETEPVKEHKTAEGVAAIDALISGLEDLNSRCRNQSQSLLVPMGGEMSYRYQEDLISTRLASLRMYREKLV
jgi:TRAP-type uncharacterized transport system substrate-binding protein